MNDFEERALLRLALRNDLVTFIHRAFQSVGAGQSYQHNWHIEVLAWQLMRCARGEVNRLLITLPPRYLKSICTSVAFVAWLLGQDPTRRIVCASYSAPLATKHARDCRNVMSAAWYRWVFPSTRVGRDKNTEHDFVTTRGGCRYSTSVGGTLTGRGGNVIIVDDPINPMDALSTTKRQAVNEWFDGTLYPRLDDKRRDVILVVMQRVHLDDLAGHLLSKDEPWVHLDLPVVAPAEQRVQIGEDRYHVRKAGDLLHAEREPQEVLDRLSEQLGSYNYSAQYLQRPIPLKGEIVKLEWFQEYTELPERGSGDQVVLSWDTASKSTELSDFSVCTIWLVHDGDYYLTGVERGKMNYPALRHSVIDLAARYDADTVIIEDRGTGTSLLQEFDGTEFEDRHCLVAYEPLEDKVTRMHAQTAVIEAGHVYLPAAADWLEALRAELLQFPNGRNDDQVDSISQFLHWARDWAGDTSSIITWV